MNIINRYRSPLLPSLTNIERDFFDESFFTHGGNTIPSVNIVETDDDFRVEMAAPGLKKEDFNIVLNDDVLTISSVKEQDGEESTNKSKYSRREYSYHSFSRSLYLPDMIKSDKIKATYQDGILAVVIPKRKEHKRAKTIKIS